MLLVWCGGARRGSVNSIHMSLHKNGTSGRQPWLIPTPTRVPRASLVRKCSIKFIGTSCCGGFLEWKRARDLLTYRFIRAWTH